MQTPKHKTTFGYEEGFIVLWIVIFCVLKTYDEP
jgi:hypothetical protein